MSKIPAVESMSRHWWHPKQTDGNPPRKQTTAQWPWRSLASLFSNHKGIYALEKYHHFIHRMIKNINRQTKHNLLYGSSRTRENFSSKNFTTAEFPSPRTSNPLKMPASLVNFPASSTGEIIGNPYFIPVI